VDEAREGLRAATERMPRPVAYAVRGSWRTARLFAFGLVMLLVASSIPFSLVAFTNGTGPAFVGAVTMLVAAGIGWLAVRYLLPRSRPLRPSDSER
jgi:hypothetical protein